MANLEAQYADYVDPEEYATLVEKYADYISPEEF
jgi:hypothetical protein